MINSKLNLHFIKIFRTFKQIIRQIYQCDISQWVRVVRADEKLRILQNNRSLFFAFSIIRLIWINFHFKDIISQYWFHKKLIENIFDSQIKMGLPVFLKNFLNHRKNSKLLINLEFKKIFRVKHENFFSFLICNYKFSNKKV